MARVLAAAATAVVAAAITVVPSASAAGSAPVGSIASCVGELLYNGICLPPQWPPRYPITDVYNYTAPPYEVTPPAVLNISLGRQLFIDSFLVDSAASADVPSWSITYHNPEQPADTNPVLRPDKPWELGAGGAIEYAFASAFSGGIWWDDAEGEYRLFYRCGRYTSVHLCLATSNDGIHWDKPARDVVPGTNIVYDNAYDGSVVWLDVQSADAAGRWKMSIVPKANHYSSYQLATSADGVHWTTVVNATGPIADRSTVFLNPFRQPPVWVYSIKRNFFSTVPRMGRSRMYWEATAFGGKGAQWTKDEPFNWTGADSLDPPVGCGAGSGGNGFTQLYNLDAVAYESVMVGLFSIFTGKECGPSSPYNRTGEWDSVFVAFSRDGFHWSRPVIDGKHRVFIDMDKTPADQGWVWNKANVQSVGGGFLVQDGSDSIYSNSSSGQTEGELRFYVGARTGAFQIDGNASVGVASMRRDGFASIGAPVSSRNADSFVQVTTRPMVFDGSYVFVNANATGGNLSVGILNATDMQPLAPWSPGACEPVTNDTTRTMIQWRQGAAVGGAEAHAASKGGAYKSTPSALVSSVADLRGVPVRLQFWIGGDADLFSFWVADSLCGESGGFVAAGGRGHATNVDVEGWC